LVASPEDEDWWTGEFNGKTGIFPKSYVEISGLLDSLFTETEMHFFAQILQRVKKHQLANQRLRASLLPARHQATLRMQAALELDPALVSTVASSSIAYPRVSGPHGPGGEAPKLIDARCTALYDFDGQDTDEVCR